MAIPDRRACFDYFRPVTRLSDWIQAFVEERSRPSHAQDFDSRELFARYDDGKQRAFAFVRNGPPEKVSVDLDLDIVSGDWMQRLRTKDENYYDAHCSVFTPSSFELLVRDAAYLGLVPFEVVEIFDAGCEFHAHLRVEQSTEALRPANYEQIRNSLLHRIQDEAAETSTKYQEMRSALEGLGEAKTKESTQVLPKRKESRRSEQKSPPARGNGAEVECRQYLSTSVEKKHPRFIDLEAGFAVLAS